MDQTTVPNTAERAMQAFTKFIQVENPLIAGASSDIVVFFLGGFFQGAEGPGLIIHIGLEAATLLVSVGVGLATYPRGIISSPVSASINARWSI